MKRCFILLVYLLCISAFSIAQESSTATTATTTGHQFVYVADPVSFQISGFEVLSNGTLAPVPGSPFSVPSQPPLMQGAIAIAYIPPYLVASGSNPNTPTSLTVFKLNPLTGNLTELPGTAPASTFLNWDFLVADPAHHVLYATGEDNGATQTNGISAFHLSSTGTVQRIGPRIVPGSREAALALDPLGRFLYAFTQGKVFVYHRNTNGTLGAQVAGSPFKVGTPITFTSGFDNTDPCFNPEEQPTIAVHPSGNFIYTSCNKGTEVTVSAVSSTGKLSAGGSVPLSSASDRLSALFVNKAGTFLFATQELRNLVLTFKLVNGHPVFASKTSTGTRPNGVAASPGSVHLFVSNGSSLIFKGNTVFGSNNLSFYSLNSAGKATQSTHSPVSTGAGPRFVTVINTP